MYRFVAAAGAAALLGATALGLVGGATAQTLAGPYVPPPTNDGSFSGVFGPGPNAFASYAPQPQVSCDPTASRSIFASLACPAGPSLGGFGTDAAFVTAAAISTSQFDNPRDPSVYSAGRFANAGAGFFTANVPSATRYENYPGFDPTGFALGTFTPKGFANSDQQFITSGVASTTQYANAGAGRLIGIEDDAPGGRFDVVLNPRGRFGGPGGGIGVAAARSPVVWEVQQRLARLGFDPGPVDGHYGPKTRAGIAAYQSRLGAYPDGRISDALLQRLRADVRG